MQRLSEGFCSQIIDAWPSPREQNSANLRDGSPCLLSRQLNRLWQLIRPSADNQHANASENRIDSGRYQAWNDNRKLNFNLLVVQQAHAHCAGPGVAPGGNRWRENLNLTESAERQRSTRGGDRGMPMADR